MEYPQAVEGAIGRYERWDPPRHTQAFVELCGDWEVMRYLGGPMTAAAAEETSRQIAEHWAVCGFGLWAAIDATGRVAGFTGACYAAWHPDHRRDVEVGWRLARWAWGRGLATEGALLALEPAFTELGVPELLAFVHPGNERSRAVIARLGMSRDGTTTDPRLHHPLEIHRLHRPNAAQIAT